MSREPRHAFVRSLIGFGLALASLLLPAVLARGDDEAVLFTPPGFSMPGKPATASGPETGEIAITVIDAETGKELAELKGHEKDAQVTCVAFGHDGTTIATGSSDKTVKVWKLAR